MTSHKLGPVTYETTPAEPANEHDLAALFPMLDAASREALEADVLEKGVLEPIVFLDALILDGRNRYYAARLHKIAYPRVQYLGDDPLGFVIGKNLHRRHLTDKQRADVAAKLAKMPRGRPSAENPSNEGITTAAAAALMDVSVAAVERAKAIEDHATPELKAAYDAGSVSASAAAEVARLPADEQRQVVAEGDDAVLARAKAIRERRAEERKAKLAEGDAARDATLAALPEGVQQQIARKAEARAAKAPDVAGRAALETIASLTAEIAELRERAEVAERERDEARAELQKFADMRAQYEAGGFEAVIAGKDEEIRVLNTRVATESADKVSWMKLAKARGRELKSLGATGDILIDAVTGEMSRG